VLALAALLGACASTPDYEAPRIGTAPAYRAAQPAAAQDAPPLDRWWLGFQDPELVRLIERALAQNLELEAAAERVEQARASAGIAAAALLPALSAQASVAAERQSLESPLGKLASASPGYDRTPLLRSEALVASWELDPAGGLKRQREQRGFEAQAAEAERLGVRVSVAAEVADAWLRIRGARLRLDLAEQRLRDDARLLELVQARRQDGLATLGEQAQAEARVAQVRATLSPLRAEIAAQQNRLAVLVGAAPGSVSVAAAPRPLALPSWGSELRPADLLRRRPDVLAAERRLAAAHAGVGVATAEYYPKLSLSALLGMESLRTGIPNAANFQPAALLGLRWRLFDFGAVDAEVARATAARREALLRYRQAMLKATEDVENAMVAAGALREESAALRDEVAAASRARDQAHEAWTGGAASLLDELELDRQYLAAQDRLSQAETETARATVAGFRALGGGW
jgi:NodT family efflux transporter outer membrane factor (OMF) lipoprotein